MDHQDGVSQDPKEHRASVHEASPRLAGAGLLVVVGVWGWWVVSLPSFSGAATAAVLTSGVAAMAWGALRGSPARARNPEGTAVPWVFLAAVTAAWQMAAYLQHPRSEHPTLSSLTNSMLDSQPARAAAFVCWLAAAAALARRR